MFNLINKLVMGGKFRNNILEYNKEKLKKHILLDSQVWIFFSFWLNIHILNTKKEYEKDKLPIGVQPKEAFEHTRQGTSTSRSQLEKKKMYFSTHI